MTHRKESAPTDDDMFDRDADDFSALTDARPSAARALADACLKAALTKRLRRRFARGNAIALVLQVPGPDWVAPIAEAAKRRFAADIFAEDGGSRSSHRQERAGAEVADGLSAGRCVIGVAQEPSRLLSSTLLTVADAHLVVAPPDAAVLRKVHMLVSGRRLRGAIPAGVARGLGFSEIVSAFRPGDGAAQVIENISSFAATKARARAAEDAPGLDELPGFDGPARDWAQGVVTDVAAWRAQKLPWRAIAASVVLCGPPGTGKTLLARSLAKTLDIPLVGTSCGAWFTSRDGHLGDVIQAAQAAFDAARAQRPSLLFIDELDGIPDRRQLSARGRDWWQPVVNFLLTLLDGAETPREGIIVIGATNFRQSLDPALIRKGRFDRIITLAPPDAPALARVLRYHLGAALPDVDLEPIARLAPGATPADAAGWALEAAGRARAGGRALEIGDLLDIVAPKDDRSLEDARRAAVHEAGHVVAHIVAGREILQVSLVAQGESGGRTLAHAASMVAPRRHDIDEITLAMLAGRAAEQEILGEASAGAMGDLAQATRMLAEARTRQGLGETLLYRAEPIDALLSTDAKLRAAVEDDLAGLYGRARKLIRARRSAVMAVAEALQKRRCLTGQEAGAVFAAAGRPSLRRLRSTR